MRAAQIEDPVERLRYLREAVNQPSSKAARVFARARSSEFWKTRGSWMMLSLICFSLSLVAWRPGHTTVKAGARGPIQSRISAGPVATAQKPATVWLVETRDGFENYSNGLRVDTKYAVSNEPREKYPVYGYGKSDSGITDWKTAPAGIVYHTTESHLAPFEPGENRHLVRIGTAVLDYVKQNRFYHFVIDRFGRVFRIVKETDVANHAGMSVWGDEKGTYVNLNTSFLGVSFESAQTPGEDTPAATPAQIHAGRVLTEMLRSKYGIPAANCVTHAQVSVNPSNMLIGWHTDWAGIFPFAEMGLPDNYAAPPASLYVFGFGYDGNYVRITGSHVSQALLVAEDRMRRQAAASRMPLPKYKASLQQRYREITAALKSKSPGKEKGDEI
jgi:hypothetical protein